MAQSPAASRVALVTGANKGIGLETVRQLAKKGYTVLLGSRDAARGQEAAAALQKEGLQVAALHIDVTNVPSIAAAERHVQATYGRLDVLVNNAGIWQPDAEPTNITGAQVRGVFDTNLFGVIDVTTTFLPLIKQSPAGRIVNLSSILGSHAEHADPNSTIFNVRAVAYDSSKAALNLYTQELALALKGTNVKVNAAHPGSVKTDMNSWGELEVSEGAETSVWLATLPDDGPTGGFYFKQNHLRW